MRPPSHCPACRRPIAFYDNIPIVSFLVLRGRCRQCGARISLRYPLVEFLNAAGYLLLYLRFDWSATFAVYALLLSALIVITFVDLQHQIIPDWITLPGIPIGAAAGSFLLPGGPVEALIGILLGGGLFYLVAVVSSWWLGQEAMGGGDIKLMAMIGGFLGWKGVLVTIFLGSLIGSLVGAWLILFHGWGRRQPLPFGPFLAAGGIVAAVWGPQLLHWYLEIGR